MHRSGTSLVSRLLNLTGVYLGAHEAISGVAPDNPKGYWEHHPLALLNDDILAAFGGRWDDPPPFPAGWTGDPRLSAVTVKARAILTSEFSAQPLWGFKDPRTCLTTPFWQELIGPMRYVICVRNPRAVAQSLHRRDAITAPQADRLWLRYAADSLTHTNGQPRMFVFYEDVIADWATQLQRLAAFVGCPDRAHDAAVRASVADFIEQELHHHRPSIADLAGDQDLSFAAKSLFLAVRAQAGDEGAADNLNLLAAQAIADARRRDALVADRDGLVMDRDRLAVSYEAQSTALVELSGSRDALQKALADVTGERDHVNAALAQRTVERDSLSTDVAALGVRLQEAERHVDEIRGSSAWALVLFLRRAIDAVFPPGTGRRRMLMKMVHGIAGHLRSQPPNEL